MPRAHAPLPLPAWLESDPPESKRAHLSVEGWVTEFEKERVHPFIREHRNALVREWRKIVERTADGRFKIEADGDSLKRSRPGYNPLQRQDAAVLGMIEDAVFFAGWPMRTASGQPGKFFWGRSGGVIGVARAVDPRKERARAICACLLNSSKAYWGRVRLKVAWRLTLMATGISGKDFTLEAAEALADMLYRADSDDA
jgi:hypothetical protein